MLELKLLFEVDSDVKETVPRKMQPKPPQPPKQAVQGVFSLSSLDLLLEDVDAESWYTS